MLAFSLVLFLLPWIEVSCEARLSPRRDDPFGDGRGAPRRDDPFRRDEPFNEVRGSLSVFYQSGLQSTWGEVSINGLLQGRGGLEWQGQSIRSDTVKTDPAPMMIGYGLCLIAGIIIGYSMRTSKLKGFLLGGVCLTACALLLAQMVVGFPFAKTFEKELAKQPANVRNGLSDVTLAVRYTPIFYLAVVMTITSFILAAIEPAVGPRKRRKRRRREDEDDVDDFADKFSARIRRLQ